MLLYRHLHSVMLILNVLKQTIKKISLFINLCLSLSAFFLKLPFNPSCFHHFLILIQFLNFNQMDYIKMKKLINLIYKYIYDNPQDNLVYFIFSFSYLFHTHIILFQQILLLPHLKMFPNIYRN